MVALVPDPAPTSDPVSELAARLEDPKVNAALHSLLDNSELIAFLVTMLDGFLRRGDEIIEGIADGVRELKGTEKPAALPSADQLSQLVAGGLQLLPVLTDALPTIQQLLASGMFDPKLIDLATVGTQAAVEGAAEAQAEQVRIKGLRKTMKVLKDDDVARTFGMVATIAKTFGRKLREQEQTSGPQHARPLPYTR